MKRFIEDMKKYYRYVLYAGQSELKAEVANSYLNWLWWVIEPICFMLIYSLVFGVFFGGRKIEHIHIFIYIGITMWDFFSRMLNSSVKSVRSNKAIVAKVYIPKYMLILVKMYVNIFKMFIAFIVLFGMAFFSKIPLSWSMLWIIPILITLYIFTFGICTFLLHFGVYVDDLGNVVRILLKIVFYLTGIFYDIEDKVTKAYNHDVAVFIGHANPMASLITAARNAILHGQRPSLKFLCLWFVVGCIISVFGIKKIYKNENSYVKVI